MAKAVPHVAITMDKSDLQSALPTLMKEVRPQWKSYHTVKFTDGLTNDLHGVYETKESDMVLLRVFGPGTELVIDRARELRTLALLYQHGCSQPVYATFQNGICYGYQEGVVLEEDMMRQDRFSELIAKEIARLHTVPIPQDYAAGLEGSHLFQGFPAMLEILPETLPDPVKNEKYQRIRSMMSIEDLKKNVEELEQVAKGFSEPLVLCHHDLLNRNLVFSEKENRVFFIDYEFAGLSYAPIDIAAHLLAYVGISNPDFQNFPSEEKQFRFLKIYLQEKKRLQGEGDEEVSEAEVGRWLVMISKMLLVNYLFWGLFALLQEAMLDFDFHFLEGAEMLFGAYCQQKEQLLAL